MVLHSDHGYAQHGLQHLPRHGCQRNEGERAALACLSGAPALRRDAEREYAGRSAVHGSASVDEFTRSLMVGLSTDTIMALPDIGYRVGILAAIGYLVLSHFFSSSIWRGMQRVLKIEHNFDNGIYALNIFVGSLFAYCWSRSILSVNLDSSTYILHGFGVALLGGLLTTVAIGTVCYLSERKHRH